MRRFVELAARPHLPRRTVRLRLTLLYGGLFLVSGVALLAVTYVLVANATGGILTFRNGQAIGAVAGSPPRSGSPTGTVQAQGASHSGIPGITPAQAWRLAQHAHAAEMRQLLISSGIALAVMSIISIALGWLVAGRVLRPLRTITSAVRDISATNLHERLALRGPDDELRELGDTFNALLGRLDESFRAQRRFVANASHELRTPLARQRALGQVAITDPDASVDSLRYAHERVLATGAQQERLIEALLTLARGQAGLDRHERLDLAGVADQVVSDRQAEAHIRGLEVRTDLSPTRTVGDPRLVERLVANLVDNALRHNVESGHLEVTTGDDGDRAVLTVVNTGPVVPASAVDRLFQPFQRLGPDRTGHGEGAGLGLSIVQAIADAHDAAVTVKARPEGGLHIEISFRCSPPAPRSVEPPLDADLDGDLDRAPERDPMSTSLSRPAGRTATYGDAVMERRDDR